DVGGLPCFSAAPDVSQLDADDALLAHDLESFWCAWPDAEMRELLKGDDYDALVFAIPVGMAPHVCGELIDDQVQWREMIDHGGAVATHALQLCVQGGGEDLGLPHPGVTAAGYVDHNEPVSAMRHLL